MPLREIQALPASLKPPIRGVDYAPLDELLRKYENDENKTKFLKKYEQYFKAITTDTSYNQSLLNVTNENSDYLQKHRLWFPYLRIESLNLPKMEELLEESENNPFTQTEVHNSDDSINNTTTTTKEKLKELTASLETNFFNYLHIPYMFGEAPFPPLINHVSNDLNNDIYTLGGLTLMDQKEQNELIHYITDDGLIPLENVQVNLSYNLPVPLNKDIIKSPFMKPNNDLYVYSTSSQTLSKPNIHSKGSKKHRKHEKDDNEVPPALLACHSCVISKRHIFYYGGFELKTTITKHDTSTTIDKEIVVNNRAWILDTGTLKFKHVALTVHPTLTTRFPAAIPRFGHLCLAIPLEEMNSTQSSPKTIDSSKETTKSSVSTTLHDKQYTNPALVYIMGGYKQSTNLKDFIPLNDIWKIELFINYENKNSNYITFNQSTLAYPIGDFDLDERNYDDFLSSRNSGQSDWSSSDEETEQEMAPPSRLKIRSRRSSSFSNQQKEPPAIFSGIIKNDNIDWPDPRGFFAGSVFDNNQLYKDLVKVEDFTDSPMSTNLAHPVPKRFSATSNYGEASKSPGGSSPLGNTVTYASGTTTYSSPPQRPYSPLSPSESSRQRKKSFSQRVESYRKLSPSHSSIATSSHATASTFSGTPVNKTLMIHGGSTFQYRVVTNSKTGKVQKFTKKKILSDLWWFNLADEKWTKVPTYLNNNNSTATTVDPEFLIQEAQVKRCGHTALKLDNRYMVLMGGALEIDFKNEAYYNDYKKDTSSDPKTSTTSEHNASSGSGGGGGRPLGSSDESNSEDVQELVLKMGSMQATSTDESMNSTEELIQLKTSPVHAHDNYHRMLILDTETQYWRISRYFHNFNLRAKNYTDTPPIDEKLAKKIGDSLKKLFFSNICGSAVTFNSKIFIIGGECRPHLPEEIAKLKKTSLAEEDTQILFSSVCVFEIPLGK